MGKCMKTRLNLAELIEIAGNIELEGKTYYTQAAEFTSNEEAKRLFLQLADWETVHYNTFKALLDGVDSDEFEQAIDPMNEAALYLDAVVGGDIFSKCCSPEELTNNNHDDIETLFGFALDREKDSIIFYTTLNKIYNNKDIASKIDIIIGEEISHIRFLHAERKKLYNNKVN